MKTFAERDIERPQKRRIKLRERLEIAVTVIGMPLHLAQMLSGISRVEERYWPIRPADVFLHIYLSATTTVITAFVTLCDLVIHRNLLEAGSVLIGTLAFAIALSQLAARIILDRWLARAPAFESPTPVEGTGRN
jgi:hypothetical protein